MVHEVQVSNHRDDKVHSRHKETDFGQWKIFQEEVHPHQGADEAADIVRAEDRRYIRFEGGNVVSIDAQDEGNLEADQKTDRQDEKVLHQGEVALHRRVGRVRRGRGEAAQQRQENFDRQEFLDQTTIAEPLLPVARYAHHEQHEGDGYGELLDAIAEDVRGDSAEDALEDESARAGKEHRESKQGGRDARVDCRSGECL